MLMPALNLNSIRQFTAWYDVEWSV